MPQKVTPVATSIVFESQWLRVEALDMGAADPSHGDPAYVPAPYYRVVENAGVICVLLSADGDFVMVRQPRPVVEMFTLEFPAGRIDAGETPEQAVRREVFEETGMRLARVQCLGQTEPIPSRLHTLQSLFIGVAAAAVTPVKERGPEMVIVPRAQFLSVIQQEGMHCLVALGAIKLAELLWSIDIFKASINEINQQFSANIHGAE